MKNVSKVKRKRFQTEAESLTNSSRTKKEQENANKYILYSKQHTYQCFCFKDNLPENVEFIVFEGKSSANIQTDNAGPKDFLAG